MRKLLYLLIFIGLLLIVKPVHAGIISRPVFNSGLVGYWSFEEGTGTKVGDASGNGNYGVWEGSGSHWTDGKFGKAGNFDGIDDYVRAGSMTALNLTGSMTLSAWIYPTANLGGNYDRIFDKDYVTSYFFGSGTGTNDLCFLLDNTSVIDTANNKITLNTWQHVAVTYNVDTGAAVIYVNGISVGTGNYKGGITGNTNHYFVVGYTDPDTNGDEFPGKIDEVRVYNRDLDTNEIQRLYETELSKVSMNQLGIVRDDLPTNASVSYVRENCTGYSPCYNTLSAWEAAFGGFDFADHSCASGDLTCLDITAVAKIDGTWNGADTTVVKIDGWTTDATRYIKIYTTAAARHNGKWDDTNKYRLVTTSATKDVIEVVEENVRIDGLQLWLNPSGGSTDIFTVGIRLAAGAADVDIRLSNNIHRGPTSSNSGCMQGPTDYYTAATRTGQVKIWNDIIYNFTKGSNASAGINTRRIPFFIYNVTIYNISGYGIYAQGTPTVSVNNVIANTTTSDVFRNEAGSFTGDYNISSDSTAPGAHSKKNTNVKFVSTTSGSEDLHLAISDTTAKDSGTDLSAVASASFSTDIDRQTRSGTWDIGADEATGIIIGASQKSQITNGLVGYWSFNGPDIYENTAVDRSGQNNNGTINGAVPDGGKVGQALNFDGTDDTVITASFRASLNITGPITISVWLYPHSLTPLDHIGFVQKTNFSSSYYFGSGDNNTDISFYYGGTQVAVTASNVLKLNQWQHVAVSYSSTGTDIYWNGTSAIHSDTTATPAGNNGSLEIGYRDDNSRWFDGLIDEVRIYNRALSADEILRLYNLGR